MSKDSSDKPQGFEEAPQKPLSGKPLSGYVSEWAEEISEEAKRPAPKKPKQPPAKTSKHGKSSRGTVIGGAAPPKERVASGLNPISGMEVSLEDAEKLLKHTQENKKKAKAKKPAENTVINFTPSPNVGFSGAARFDLRLGR